MLPEPIKNLHRINPPHPDVACGRCRGCGAVVWASAGYADLDGEPFKAYYCLPCGDRLSEQGLAEICSTAD